MKKMNMLGINLACLSYEEMYPIFDKWLEDKSSRSHSVAAVNVHCCVSGLFDRKLRRLYNSADLVGIDSMPFLRWARLFHYRKSDRFYPPDMILEICKRAQVRQYTFFFYGGTAGSPDKMEEYLTSRFSNVKVVGKYSPPFRPLTEEEDREVCEMINRAKPDFLWVGLGSPKQDVWIAEHREKIHGTIMVAAGALFDFFSGRIKQAPRWVRDAGFEWFYRLTKDFRRLWKRYTLYNVVFLFMFFLQVFRLYRVEAVE